MNRIYPILYNVVVVPLFRIVLLLAGTVNRKVRRGLDGRRDMFRTLGESLEKLPKGKPRFWFHSSSLGEFEQAKPIIAELKRRTPDAQIIVSFFSPSGYEPSRKYKLADVITYLPIDTAANAKRFVELVRPTAAIIVRYDVWPNHIWKLAEAGIPIILANATMRPTTKRLLPGARSFHSALYRLFRAILTVSASDAVMFERFELNGVHLSAIGDTRYDQVIIRRTEAEAKHLLPPSILRGKKIFVAGSTWENDEEVLIPVFNKLQKLEPGLIMVLVPHEPTIENLERIEAMMNGKTPSIRFSDLNDYKKQRVIIVDSIGVLVALYKYANVAFVGGGFRAGVHNVLEPAVYGIPVLYGPRYRNSQEASLLIDAHAGFVVNDETTLYRTLRTMLEKEKIRSAAGNHAAQFVAGHAGATERFLSSLNEIIGSEAK